jgi:hypothetical protein
MDIAMIAVTILSTLLMVEIAVPLSEQLSE